MRSEELFERAKRVIPGGVNSPVRAFEPHPFFVTHAKGSRLYSIDGVSYVDYCLAYGPLILGHAHPEVVEAVKAQLDRGTMYGAPTKLEVELAKLVVKLVPYVDLIRLVNTGTEATMHAIRLARAYTQRSRIVKFDGCYHGAHDAVLVKAGSGATTFGTPTSPGIPGVVAKETLVIPYNDFEAFEELMEGSGSEVAAVIIEPVMGNVGLIPPKPGFLQLVRKLSRREGALLIFDEIITGFRLSIGGAQEYYNVNPDLTTLGKIMGGGFPLAAFGGREEIMCLVSPSGPVYQAGTYSGNPVSVTAGLTTLRVLERDRNEIYPRLERACVEITDAIRDVAEDVGVGVYVNSIASMFQVFFADRPVTNAADARSSSIHMFKRYHAELLRRGIFVPPSQFETCFLSTAHGREDLAETIDAIQESLRALV